MDRIVARRRAGVRALECAVADAPILASRYDKDRVTARMRLRIKQNRCQALALNIAIAGDQDLSADFIGT